MNPLFNIENKLIIITGGTGVLGSCAAKSLAKAKAKIVVLGRSSSKVLELVEELNCINPYSSIGFEANILSEDSLNMVKEKIVSHFGRIDVLLNVAGGNMPGATIGPEQSIFDLKMNDFNSVTELNLNGTVIPSLVFGKVMSEQKEGAIINYSSMAVDRAITRVVGYSASKAAMENFTRWMAVEMATKFGGNIRINAIAPGFFIGNQNRKLLTNEDGSYTDRGKDIIKNTPMGRFGEAEELNGTIHFLCSEASKFVTGAVIPVDGGFNVFSGV